MGVPDARYGEAVAAFVVKHEGGKVGVDEVKAWVKEKLSHHLGTSWGTAPGWIGIRANGGEVPTHVFWVEGFPKTASGKIQKFRLKEMAVEMLLVDGKSG